MIRILAVDDEKPIRELLRLSMGRAGYTCDLAADGLEALHKIEQESYDLILLDVMLPEIDGFTLMEYIAQTQTPVIFLTAKNAVADRVKGLHLGAEDYIIKPFDVLELQARVEGVLRRHGKLDSVFSVGGLTIDTRSMQVTRDGEELQLTRKEYELLLLFARNPGIVLSRESIYERIWGGEYPDSTRTVELHIQRMKKKAGWDGLLKPVYGLGYRLSKDI